MENETKKFDPADAMLSVKEKIKDSFVSLIPEEQWNETVKKEIERYFQEGQEYHKVAASNFTRDVHAVLNEEVTQRVKFYLQQNFHTVWSDNGISKYDAKVEEMITKNACKILADMIGGLIQLTLNNDKL